MGKQSVDTASFNILLVEDNPADAELVRMWISDSELPPIEIIHRKSLDQALETLQGNYSFEAILLDLSLPDSRGFNTLERVLKTDPHANIIVLTGLKDKALGIKAVKAGAQDFLVKGQFKGELLSKTLLYAIERQHNAELRQARDVAVRSEQMKERFLANISHEMRTPLNAVLGMSRLLDKTDLDSEQEDYVRAIQHSSEVLLGIINDILEMSALKEGKIHFDNKIFSFEEQLKQVCDVMEYRSREKELQLNLFIDDSVPENLMGDPLRLNQIFYNLIGNAIKFTDKGSVDIKAGAVSRTARNCRLYVEVKDSGKGIPADRLEYIFKPFTRIDESRFLQPGTGLGLSIARYLVEKQGGVIEVQSEEGKGSVFRFEMPFELPREKPEDKSAKAGTGYNWQDRRILVVEDHKINRMLVKKMLHKQWPDLEVIEAENGQIALEKLEHQSADLVLMDLFMPQMDGYDATREIRRIYGTGLPVIALTAHATGKGRSSLNERGFDDYILKPFHPEQLFKKITYYLSKNE